MKFSFFSPFSALSWIKRKHERIQRVHHINCIDINKRNQTHFTLMPFLNINALCYIMHLCFSSSSPPPFFHHAVLLSVESLMQQYIYVLLLCGALKMRTKDMNMERFVLINLKCNKQQHLSYSFSA
jgi:hypothetical protein